MHLTTKLLLGAVGVAVGFLGFIYSGLFNVSALVPHSQLVTWMLSSTMHASVERRAAEIDVPEFDDEMRLAGINDFAAMCSGCHGAPGQEPEPTGVGLNPPAPDLAEVATQRNAAELFWVTKHGIRMTGMPGWWKTHDDSALWPVVAFMRLLPTLDRDSYKGMLARAKGAGHHIAGEQASRSHDNSAHPLAAAHPAAAEVDSATSAPDLDASDDGHSQYDSGNSDHHAGDHLHGGEAASATSGPDPVESHGDHSHHAHTH